MPNNLMEVKLFKAKKGLFFQILILSFWGFLLFVLYLLLFSPDSISIIVLFSILPFFVLPWIYFDTYYKTDKEFLYYKSAFLQGKIPIQSITKLEPNKTLWAGLKPALATNGIIISFNKYDEIYIAPENNLEIIAELKNINPNIEVAS
jgi:hypothetical protein